MDYYYKLKHGNEYWYISLINGDIIVIDRDINDFHGIKEYEEKFQMYFPFDFEFIDDKFQIKFRHLNGYFIFRNNEIIDTNSISKVIPKKWKDYKDLIKKLISNLVIIPTLLYRTPGFYCGYSKAIFKLVNKSNNNYTLVSDADPNDFFGPLGIMQTQFPVIPLEELKLYIQFLNCNYTCETSLVINDNNIVINGIEYPIKSRRGKFFCVCDVRTLINVLNISSLFFFKTIGKRIGIFPQFDSKEKLKDTIKKLNKHV